MKKQNFLWKDFRFSPLELISQLRILYFEFISGHFVTLRMFVNYPQKKAETNQAISPHKMSEFLFIHAFIALEHHHRSQKVLRFVGVKTYFTNLCHFRTRSVDKAFAKWYATLTHFCYLFNIDLYTVHCTMYTYRHNAQIQTHAHMHTESHSHMHKTRNH